MASKVWALLLLATVFFARDSSASTTLRAYFSSGGVQGTVVVSEFSNMTGMYLSVNSTQLTTPSQPGQMLLLTVFALPVLPGRKRSLCSATGAALPELSSAARGLLGDFLRDGTVQNVATTLRVVDLVGRALVVTEVGGSIVACANLQHVEDRQASSCSSQSSASGYQNYEATFNGMVAGQITFRRLAASNISAVYSHLFWTNDAPSTTSGHFMRLYNSSTASSAGSGSCDLYTLSLQLDTFQIQSQAPTVPIGSTPQELGGRQALGLYAQGSQPDPFSQRAVVVVLYAVNSADSSQPGTMLACGRLQPLRARRLLATFTGTYAGTVQVRQDSPQSSAVVSSMFNPAMARVRSAIHSLPVQTSQCGSIGGLYNPFNVSSSTAGQSTPDSFPVGSIGRKQGYMPRRDMCDPTVSLFGRYSLNNRSVAILNSANQPVQCAPLAEQLDAGDRFILAKATFSGDVSGTIYLSHVAYSDGMSNGETTLFSPGLTSAAGRSSRHNMHVHVGRVGWQANASACAGAFAGGHYNPHAVGVGKPRYPRECTEDYPLRCETGDVSLKAGKFDLDGQPFLRHVPHMPLRGPQSVIGRSFVIHAPNGGGPRIACANIVPLTANTFQLEFNVEQLNGRAPSLVEFRRLANNALSRRGFTATVLDTLDVYNTSSTVYIRGAVDGSSSRQAAGTLLSEDLGAYTHMMSAATPLKQNFMSIAALLAAALCVMLL